MVYFMSLHLGGVRISSENDLTSKSETKAPHIRSYHIASLLKNRFISQKTLNLINLVTYIFASIWINIRDYMKKHINPANKWGLFKRTDIVDVVAVSDVRSYC